MSDSDDLVRWLDGEAELLRGAIARNRLRRGALARERVAGYEAGLVAKGSCAAGELAAWLEEQLGTACWEDAPADDLREQTRRFLAGSRAKQQQRG